MSKGKLLEDLAARADCLISSLRDVSKLKKICRLLLETDPARYGLEEWEYTLSYLTGKPTHFADYEQIRRLLKKYAE